MFVLSLVYFITISSKLVARISMFLIHWREVQRSENLVDHCFLLDQGTYGDKEAKEDVDDTSKVTDNVHPVLHHPNVNGTFRVQEEVCTKENLRFLPVLLLFTVDEVCRVCLGVIWLAEPDWSLDN